MSLDHDFEDFFKISTLSMRLSRSHPSIARNLFWKVWITFVLLLNAFTISVLLNSVVSYDFPNGKYTEGCKNLIMAIVAITITFKFLISIYYRNPLRELINSVDQDYESARQFCEEEKKIVLDYVMRGIKMCKLWCLCVVTTSIIFPIKAFWPMACSYWRGQFQPVPIFDMTYPTVIEIHKNDPIGFFSLLMFCCTFGTFTTTIYVGFDPLVPIFMLHYCGQLDIMACRISKIFSESQNERQICEDMKSIILKLQQIYKSVENIKTNFAFIYEYNMKTTTMLLPLTAFHIKESLRYREINLEFISFFVADILHFYLPCYFSDLLMEQSAKFGRAVYSCGWEQCPNVGIRKTVLFLLTWTTVPLGINTIFSPICLDTFANMCRQSYTIFNLMNAAWG